MVSSPTTLAPPILVLMLGGSILWASTQFPELPDGHPGPGLFPSLVGGALLLLGGVLLFFHPSTSASADFSKNRAWALLFLILPLPWLGQWIGLAGVAILLSLGVGWLLKIPMKPLLLIAGGSGLGIWLVFTLGLGITL